LLPLFPLLDRSPVMSDSASHGGAHNGMSREMSGNAANHGSLEASCGLCGLNRRSNKTGDKQQARNGSHGCFFHLTFAGRRRLYASVRTLTAVKRVG
jgi:hypothetical protein